MPLTKESSQLDSIPKAQARPNDPRDNNERWLE